MLLETTAKLRYWGMKAAQPCVPPPAPQKKAPPSPAKPPGGSMMAPQGGPPKGPPSGGMAPQKGAPPSTGNNDEALEPDSTTGDSSIPPSHSGPPGFDDGSQDQGQGQHDELHQVLQALGFIMELLKPDGMASYFKEGHAISTSPAGAWKHFENGRQSAQGAGAATLHSYLSSKPGMNPRSESHDIQPGGGAAPPSPFQPGGGAPGAAGGGPGQAPTPGAAPNPFGQPPKKPKPFGASAEVWAADYVQRLVKAGGPPGKGPGSGHYEHTHNALVHAVTQHDIKESGKKYYNPYALPQYLKAVQDAVEEHRGGKDLRSSLVGHFNGRLLDKVLKSVGLPKSTREEQLGL